ncbi:hypothetical protein JCM10908_005314 [Rhodotorula pacifica]|uniref:uncharacterized protein n=1 Tax=Rhodotorula pacifica TaxID=1495444 RepID=UPI00317FB259
MASSSRLQGTANGPANYVFKMHYDAGGPSPLNRRYGYSGELALPQVYEGLQERASQAFGVPREQIAIHVRDTLGNPDLHLDTYQAFLRHVYMPLQQRPHEAKIDEKKRIVLAFVVLNKKQQIEKHLAKVEAAEKDLHAREAALAREKVKAAEAWTKKQKLERQATLAKAQAEVRAQHASARPATSKTPRTASPTLRQAPAETEKVPEPSKAATAAAPSSAQKVCAKPAQAPQAVDTATAWTGVQGLLETFVDNLNAHLADTFGDAAIPLDFKTLSSAAAAAKKPISTEAAPPEPAPVPAKERAKTRAEQPPRPVYHPSVFCDGCNEDLFGPRYKCLHCSNYDLCGKCMDQRDSHHPASHPFAEIRVPGAAHEQTTRGSKSAAAPAPAAAPVRHAATCNLCDKTIFGARYKCLECPDFDLDAECYDTNVRELHPGHKFVRLQSPRDYVPSYAPPTPVRHRHVRCEGCQREPIVGVRYRCMHPDCADYDLCGDCEALPIAVHPRDHPLLKIREPLDPWTDRSKVAVARDRASALIARSNGASGSSEKFPPGTQISDILKHIGLYSPEGSSQPAAVSNVQVIDGPGQDKTITADVVLQQLVEAPVGKEAETAKEFLQASVAAAEGTYDAEPSTDEITLAAEEVPAAPSTSEVEVDSPPVAEPEAEVHSPPAMPAATPATHSTPRATFVSDITLLDGISVPAGAEFQKVWAVRAGPSGWPAGCRLVHVGGFSSKHFATDSTLPSSFEVQAAAPDEVVSVSCDCKAPEDSGRFMDFWRLALPDGTLFGERLWIDLTIEAPASNSSASSSSILFMAPSLDAQGKAGPSSRGNSHGFESVASVSVHAVSHPSSPSSMSEEDDFVFLSGDSGVSEDEDM